MLVVGQMYHPLSSSRCSPTQRMLHSTQTQCAFHTRFPHSKKLTPHTRLVVHCTVHASSSSTAVDAPTFEQYLLSTHQDTLQAIEQLDGSGKVFRQDHWQRGSEDANAGYGITCVLEGGDLIEKGAVNITVVNGVLSAERAKAMSSRGRQVDASGGQPYSAAAMSLVLHPKHPMVPTLRGDVRVFEVDGCCWYGGGCDLTPAYLFDQDAVDFHTFWKHVCDSYCTPHTSYQTFKAWCDRYFYIPARKEHRGVGGLFFDDLVEGEEEYDVRQFVEAVGRQMIDSWAPIVHRRRDLSYTQQQRQWQLLRRGRYLEFNLLYDRGVRFGLDGGRIESIMVSAPPLIAWQYDVQPDPGTPEEALVQTLQTPREWV